MGMHRSGTGMISGMLEALGLFMGAKKEKNNESRFFLEINRWLLRQCGGSWYYPEPFKQLLRNVEALGLTIDYVSYLLKSPRAVMYLGWFKYLVYRTPFNLEIPWGWKDPRNIYTLPIWLKLFPEAKVIHVYRHGLDVANSLYVREKMFLARSKRIYHRRKAFYWLRPKCGGFIKSLECCELERGFALWEKYVDESRRQIRDLGSRALETKYEDVLSDPANSLKRIARFCEMEIVDKRLREVATHVKRDRLYAYKRNDKLKKLAAQFQGRLNAKGY